MNCEIKKEKRVRVHWLTTKRKEEGKEGRKDEKREVSTLRRGD